jgi:hypothetical protein
MRLILARVTLPLLAIISMLSFRASAPAQAAITPLGQSGCPRGTVVGGPNLVTNGDFSQGSTGFESDLPDRGPGVYPDDPVGGFSIQTGVVSYFNGFVEGRPFPGDTQREAAPSETYFYSNPGESKSGDPPPFTGVLWRQTVTGLLPGTVYNFYAYIDNLLIPGSSGADPTVELRVGAPGEPTVEAGPPIMVPKTPDAWVPVQYSFQTGGSQTSVVLEIFDRTAAVQGDDFGMTAINLRQCVSGLGLAKSVSVPIDNLDGSYSLSYTILVKNYGQGTQPLTDLQVVDDLAKTFEKAASWRVTGLSSDRFTVNTAYDGRTDVRLLTGTDQLAPMATGTILLEVEVRPSLEPGGVGPFDNTAFGSALAGNVLVQDDSAPGTNPDPDGDSDPKNPLEDIPTRVFIGGPTLYIPLTRR